MNKIYVGIDLGGTNIKIGVVSNGQIIAQTALPAHAELPMQKNLPGIRDAINALLKSANLSHTDLGGVGISFPSVVDNQAKRILTKYVKFPGAESVDFNQWSMDCWNVPVALENDARAALVAEWQYGSGKGYKNIVLVTLGTGFGSAVLIDGQLFRGAHHAGGNLGGHTIINFKGQPCNCGARGCMETEASGWVLDEKWKIDPEFRESKLADEPQISFVKVFEWAAQDAFANKILSHSLHAWSANIFNLVHHFDPQIVIMGGGIMKSGDKIIPQIQKFLDDNIWQGSGVVKVVPATHTDFAGMLGMAYLASL
ncbi:MAG: ROK family protein [Saprospiraceae bacterium]|nr:ROK family protein [Saprospiraceae bacterium]